MNTMLRKSILGIAGLGTAVGLAAGPLNHGTDSDPTPTNPIAAVQADTPDTSTLLPHGTPTGQSTIELDDEQVGNVKAIIAAT
ncbi:hypothetical protein HCA58_08625, partial [Micromonospora sp. HNM0581]|nr:hypothetical protein [Micromonospora sp. HNM0581]